MATLWLVCIVIFLVFYRDGESLNSPTHEDEVTKALSIAKESEVGAEVCFATKSWSSNFRAEFARIEIVVLLATTFFVYFNQTSLETIVVSYMSLFAPLMVYMTISLY